MESNDSEEPSDENPLLSPVDQILGQINDSGPAIQKVIDGLNEIIDDYTKAEGESKEGLLNQLEAETVAAWETLRTVIPLAKAEQALRLGAQEDCRQEVLQAIWQQTRDLLTALNKASDLIATS